ncbi:cadherin repeat domain-containing protein [Balneolaceae bacterium YR4-1]|uniref:Cadherin repeat domain-containing protein n=1 Tax=Halalkalibaculum roseum TaxID=2709311 RepID=A0A6M1TAG4_9BACT|nr:putative Ig domain-containing protein [Halalkalibaculum roseum]NGP77153.1 cadherin repeat domain-containing protein [Halalkalibaculum roseum]
MISKRILSITLLLIFGTLLAAQGQPSLTKDYTTTMEIPSVIAMESSPAHLYVLSNSEGMVVFRAHNDSLQWLYSSTGMEQRGNRVTADIRFAYLFGYNRRLTVLEPTSVLGVYSSTLLPEKPLDAQRIEQKLYLALGSGGLARISLRNPASVDSTAEVMATQNLQGENIIDLEGTDNQLFVLSNENKLYVFQSGENGITLSRELSLLRNMDRIFLLNQNLIGSDKDGNIYEINREGDLSKLGSIGEEIQKIRIWKDWLIIKGTSNRIWTSYQNRAPVLWKDDADAGNYFTVTKDQFWLSEYNQISRIVAGQPAVASNATENSPALPSTINMKPVNDQVVPYPKPLLLDLELEGNIPAEQIQYAYQSDIQSAKIRSNGFYWQPKADDVGEHRFKVVATASNGATDSTTFSVDVRSFNAPPRFAPLRPISIPVGESFTLPIKATDPDGMHQDLVRYLGVDLPEGATVNEQTGEFSWTPTARQVGENNFRVIATDQYGAASSVDITIRVVNAQRGSENGN